LIELSIAGLGIPESEQAMIFEEFYSGAEPDRLGATASPLGLATVKKTAQAHGGDIGVHSEDGELTVFTVRLPLVSKQ
jgi:signal transduction histidine kinase